MKNRILALGALALVALMLGAATIGTLASLPDSSGGVFTAADATQINADVTIANTNFTNVNAALALLTLTGSAQACGTTTTCSATNESTALKIVVGNVALATGSPSTAAVTGMSPAFTSASTYSCVAQDATTVATAVGVLTAGYVSGSAVTFTGPNTNTDTIRYTCTGY
jgi:hypothetical protein